MSERPLVVVDADVLGRRRTGDETYVTQLLRELPAVAADLRIAAVTRDPELVPDGIEPVQLSARSQELQKDGAWLREHGIAGQNYRTEGGNPGVSVPTTFILDRSGAVSQFRNTAVDWQLHADFVRTLLPGGSARG